MQLEENCCPVTIHIDYSACEIHKGAVLEHMFKKGMFNVA